jgi:oligoendopeptidase F
MNWDLTSYFPQFDGAEMRRFKQALRRDIASLKEKAASLVPLNDENASEWEDVLSRNEDLTRRMSHLSSYVSCLAASDGRNEDYLKEEAALASMRAELAKVRDTR